MIYLSRKCLLNLYHAFAYPYLIYCVELWGHSSDTILRPIFLVQKKVVRIITFSDFLAHTRPIFLKLNLLLLSKVILQRTSIFMYKLMNDMLPAALDYLIFRNNDIHQYNTRQKHQLYMVPVQLANQLYTVLYKKFSDLECNVKCNRVS